MIFVPAVQVRYNEKDEKVWKVTLMIILIIQKSYYPRLYMIYRIGRRVQKYQMASLENIPFIPIEVVRELVANALVHRTYTTRGDIFVNLFPDRLEIHNLAGCLMALHHKYFKPVSKKK